VGPVHPNRKDKQAQPRNSEHFVALLKLGAPEEIAAGTLRAMDRQMATLGTPSSGQMGTEVEKTLMQYCDALEDCLGWHEHTWLPCKNSSQISISVGQVFGRATAVVGAHGELVADRTKR